MTPVSSSPRSVDRHNLCKVGKYNWLSSALFIIQLTNKHGTFIHIVIIVRIQLIQNEVILWIACTQIARTINISVLRAKITKIGDSVYWAMPSLHHRIKHHIWIASDSGNETRTEILVTGYGLNSRLHRSRRCMLPRRIQEWNRSGIRCWRNLCHRMIQFVTCIPKSLVMYTFPERFGSKLKLRRSCPRRMIAGQSSVQTYAVGTVPAKTKSDCPVSQQSWIP